MEQEPANQNPDRLPNSYFSAARFPNDHDSGRAFHKIQGILYRHIDNDVSAFRFQLSQLWIVAVLGEHPPLDLAAQLEKVLSAGRPADVPGPIRSALAERRARAIEIGPWV